MSGNLKALVHGRQRYTNEQYACARAEIQSIAPPESLIPWASPAQAEFEAQLLDRVGYGISPQNASTGVQHPFGIASLVPRENEIEIFLQPSEDTLEEFIVKVSPFVGDDFNFSGVNGLRATFTPRDTILSRLHSGGRVVLRGVTEAAWNTAFLNSFDEAYDDIEAIKLDYPFAAPTLHEVERYDLKRFPWDRDSRVRAQVVNSMLSGVLRRAHVFRARSKMKFTDLWFNWHTDGALINIEWAGDLSHFDLVRNLLQGKFGLPLEIDDRKGCYCEPCMGTMYSFKLRDTLGANVEFSLRRSDLYDDVLPPRDSGSCWRISQGDQS